MNDIDFFFKHIEIEFQDLVSMGYVMKEPVLRKENDSIAWVRQSFMYEKIGREILFVFYPQSDYKIDITILDLSDRMQDYVKLGQWLDINNPDMHKENNAFIIEKANFKDALLILFSYIKPVLFNKLKDTISGNSWQDH